MSFFLSLMIMAWGYLLAGLCFCWTVSALDLLWRELGPFLAFRSRWRRIRRVRPHPADYGAGKSENDKDHQYDNELVTPSGRAPADRCLCRVPLTLSGFQGCGPKADDGATSSGEGRQVLAMR